MAKLSTIKVLCMTSWFFIIIYFFTTTTCSNETDLLSLLAFKNAIHDDPLGALNSWNVTLNFCTWNGILCGHRHQNRVVSIDLASQGLVGVLSPHIGNLSFLREINLQNNSFYSKIPEEIGRLRRLKSIIFSNNSFSGEIPRNLSKCSNLEYLNLVDNHLTGNIVPELGSLLKLEVLGLGKNNLSGTIPPSLGNLTSLIQLYLVKCGLVGEIPESLSQLQKMKFLKLGVNMLVGRIPYGLCNISTISSFTMGDNRLKGNIPCEMGIAFPRLQVLDLSKNRLTGTLPISLSNASFLESFIVHTNNFTGKMIQDFQRLPNLQYLVADYNNFEGDINFISSLTNHTNLVSFYMAGNLLSGSLPDTIGNFSEQLLVLSLDGNNLNGTIPSAIGNLIGLTGLFISNCNLNGPLPMSIGKLNSLRELYLGGNELSNELPSSLSNLTLLSDLVLAGNNFIGRIPQSVNNCINLLSLDLSYNNFNGSIPREIFVLSSLSITLSLAYNAFTGSIPSEVGSLKNLAELDLSHNRLSGLIPNSTSKCTSLERLYLESNSIGGEIPDLIDLMGLSNLDLSQNNLSGQIPRFLGDLRLVNLNLSFNSLQGEVPTQGVFQNASLLSLQGNKKLCGGIELLNLPPCSSTSSKKNHLSNLWKILIPVLGVGFICLTLAACFFVFVHRRKKLRNLQPSIPSFDEKFLRLSYADILKSTGEFSEENLLGAGRFGSVFKGFLDAIQMHVAVKVINLATRGATKSFMSEYSVLRSIRHKNLLKIFTICSSTDFQGNDFKALVYEYMANGNLDKWIHQNEAEDGEWRSGCTRNNLSLIQRLNICIDIACGVEYLHCGTDSVIVHGDLKPSNIILDENMTAYVGDFGLAKVISSIISENQSSSMAIMGTIGYIPPEYGMSAAVSPEGDVYSYGILLLEIFTNKRPTDHDSQSSLHDLVSQALKIGQVMTIVDPSITREHTYDMSRKINHYLTSLLEIGVACSKEIPRERMWMTDVVAKLHKIKKAYVAEL